MTKKNLLVLWGVLFVLCAGLGFVPLGGEVPAPVQAAMTAVSVGFFAPPALLLYRSGKDGDRNTLRLLRNLSLASLVLTLVLLVLNLVAAVGSQLLGDLLHGMLVVISTPMLCSGYWALSLFLWACLLMASLKQLRKK